MEARIFPTIKALVSELHALENRLTELEKQIFAIPSDKLGPRTYSYHLGNFRERIGDIAAIVERIGTEKYRIVELNIREQKYMPKRIKYGPQKQSKVLTSIRTEKFKLDKNIKVDAESLYVFGNIALDQWSYSIAYLLGLDDPESYDFHKLVERLNSKNPPSHFTELVQQNLSDAVWLFYQLRFYRNIFIEHARRPWQRGTTASVYTDSFQFFVPTPVGWFPKEKEAAMLESLRNIKPDWIKVIPKNSWQLQRPKAFLELLYKQIDTLSPSEQKRVWQVWEQLGGQVVSYDHLTRRLLKFFNESIATISKVLAEHPEYPNNSFSPD